MTDAEKKAKELEDLKAAQDKAAGEHVDVTGHAVATEDEIKALADAAAAMKALNDQAIKEREEFGEVLGETTAKLEASNKRLDVMESGINAKFDALEARLNKRSRNDDGSDRSSRDKGERSALYFKHIHAAIAVEIGFDGFQKSRDESAKEYNAMLKSDPSLNDMQVKVLQIGDNTLGGFNAPPEFINELIVDLQEQNPVRGLFTARTTSNKSIQVPRQTGFLAATWVAELGTRSETTGTVYGREEITAHELHAQVDVSREDLEDTFFNMESFVKAQLVEQFGRTEGVAFVNGNGVGQPTGFLQDSAVDTTTSAISANFEADDLIRVFYELLDPYVANSNWVMRRDTIRIIRQFKDGNGQYLWAAGIATDARPATILGQPYVAADEMPAVGASNVVAVFGDFRRAYTVVDRIKMEMITDIFSSKATGTVEFSARKRVGGQVLVAQALKSLTCGA